MNTNFDDQLSQFRKQSLDDDEQTQAEISQEWNKLRQDITHCIREVVQYFRLQFQTENTIWPKDPTTDNYFYGYSLGSWQLSFKTSHRIQTGGIRVPRCLSLLDHRHGYHNLQYENPEGPKYFFSITFRYTALDPYQNEYSQFITRPGWYQLPSNFDWHINHHQDCKVLTKPISDKDYKKFGEKFLEIQEPIDQFISVLPQLIEARDTQIAELQAKWESALIPIPCSEEQREAWEYKLVELNVDNPNSSWTEKDGWQFNQLKTTNKTQKTGVISVKRPIRYISRNKAIEQGLIPNNFNAYLASTHLDTKNWKDYLTERY